jgi:hypothetical protein
VPSQWLAASITPIAKVEHPSSWSDYRPISLTSNLCKVFEKIIVKFILSITWRIWKSNKQYGFLPGRSTVDAAVHVFYDISKAFDRAISSLAIFFDFAKAFDLVPHDKLLAKLLGYCQLPAWLVRWIANYLTGRAQCVRIGTLSTEWKPVEAGVIQGSVLGPILFILFIADLNDYLPTGVSFAKYADDIVAYIIGLLARVDNLPYLPQLIADAIQRWCVDNGMRLNSSKCKVMVFKPPKNSTPVHIVINNTVLEIVSNYTYLGFDINTKLDSSAQWDRVYSSICGYSSLLSQLKSSGISLPILVNVFKSLVLCHLRYSSTLLIACTDSIKHDINALQSRMLKIIGITRADALKDYGITETSNFITSCCISQVTRVLNSASHPLRLSLLKPPPLRDMETRSNFEFFVPTARNAKFASSAVMITLSHLEKIAAAAKPQKPEQPAPLLPPPVVVRGVSCPNAALGCKEPNRLWKRLDLHLSACNKNCRTAPPQPN